MASVENIYQGFGEGYQAVMKSQGQGQHNLALRFERFYPYEREYKAVVYSSANESPGKPSENTTKFDWIKQFDGNKAGYEEQLKQAHKRRQRLCDAIGGTMFELKLDWRFLTGSGNPHPIENGLTWHPTLGVPYLPASGFKGLLRAFLEHWQGDTEKKSLTLFGDTEAAGQLQFFDLLPVEPVKLIVDVMTPHYANWYVGGAENPDLDSEKIPAPWHNPVPIPFLVAGGDLVLRGMVGIRPQHDSNLSREESYALWQNLASLLEDAFAVAGAGAKTATGYGRMKFDRALFEKQRDEKRKKERQEMEGARQTEKENLLKQIPTERFNLLLPEILKQDSPKDKASYLVGKKFKNRANDLKLSDVEIADEFSKNEIMREAVKLWFKNSNKSPDEAKAYKRFGNPLKN